MVRNRGPETADMAVVEILSTVASFHILPTEKRSGLRDGKDEGETGRPSSKEQQYPSSTSSPIIEFRQSPPTF